MSARVLSYEALKAWFGTKGFLLVLAAAFVPLALTGAWLATHQSDAATTEIRLDPPEPTEGDTVNVTAIIQNKGRFTLRPFNATLAVWNDRDLARLFDPESGRLRSNAASLVGQGKVLPEASNVSIFEGLRSGEQRELRFTWTPLAGTFVLISTADAGTAADGLVQFLVGTRKDQIPELEESNNLRFDLPAVRYRPASPADAPPAPGNLTGPAGELPRADLMVTNLSFAPDDPSAGDRITFSATVTNLGPDAADDANVTIRVGQRISGNMVWMQATSQNVSLGVGESTREALEGRQIRNGIYWAEASANLTGVAYDADVSNNAVTRPIIVQFQRPDDFTFPEPSDKLTVKRFYVDMLQILHLRILLPLISLFYAAGVLADDRERGNLVHILIRPVSLPLFLASKFAAGFLVAIAATAVGLFATFLALLGSPEGNIGFLTTPLFVSGLALLSYGSLFVLLGVLVERPYLAGLGFVAWEWLITVGEVIRLEGKPLVAPWAENFTLSHHLFRIVSGETNVPNDGWVLDDGLQLVPEGFVAVGALASVALAVVAFIAVALAVIQRREHRV